VKIKIKKVLIELKKIIMKKLLFSLIIVFTMTISFCFAQVEKQDDNPYSFISYESSEDGSKAWVTFSVPEITKIYLLSIISGEESIKASGIANTNGDMHANHENGATMRAGSDVMMGNCNWVLDAGTVVKCFFKKDITFIATRIEFIQTKDGQSFFYNLETKEWE